MAGQLIVYQFSRSKVECGDFSHFLGLYHTDKLPSGRTLREMMNSLTFMIEGFDSDPRELYSIPEVRRFYAAFCKAWPYWLFFCNLDSEELRMMTLCCLPSLAAVRVEQQSKVVVEYDRHEMLEFLRENLSSMNALCQRGGMFEKISQTRTRSIFAYFGLPTDVSAL